jgi:hypothetical protein
MPSAARQTAASSQFLLWEDADIEGFHAEGRKEATEDRKESME